MYDILGALPLAPPGGRKRGGAPPKRSRAKPGEGKTISRKCLLGRPSRDRSGREMHPPLTKSTPLAAIQRVGT